MPPVDKFWFAVTYFEDQDYGEGFPDGPRTLYRAEINTINGLKLGVADTNRERLDGTIREAIRVLQNEYNKAVGYETTPYKQTSWGLGRLTPLAPYTIQEISNKMHRREKPLFKVTGRHERLDTLDIGPLDAITRLADGNPGAMTVMMLIVKNVANIDPATGDIGWYVHLSALDSIGLYGPDIWMLYKDVCGLNLPKVIALLRAVQFGMISGDELRHAVQNEGVGINVDDIVANILEELPSLKMDYVGES